MRRVSRSAITKAPGSDVCGNADLGHSSSICHGSTAAHRLTCTDFPVNDLGVLVGIFVAIVLSLGDFVRRAWRPYDAVLGREDELKGYHDLERHPNARQVPGLLLYRFDAPLFFANADYFRRRIGDLVATTTPPIRWVVVAAEPITDVDTTAADTLLELLGELQHQEVVLAFAEMKGPVKDRLRRYGLYAQVESEHFFPTVGTAVDGYLRATGLEWVDWEERPDRHRKS